MMQGTWALLHNSAMNLAAFLLKCRACRKRQPSHLRGSYGTVRAVAAVPVVAGAGTGAAPVGFVSVRRRVLRCCPRGFRECEAAGAHCVPRPRDPQARAHCALRAPLRARGDTTTALRQEALPRHISLPLGVAPGWFRGV
jgi:hypothetical protein